jgi:1,4-alpha-glucan branching enzyme
MWSQDRGMITKRPSSEEGRVRVSFQIPGSVWAECIHLVGDFNEWDRQSLPFRHTRENVWQIEIDLDVGRRYRFRYLIDGVHWRNDLHADGYTVGAEGASDSVVAAELGPV